MSIVDKICVRNNTVINKFDNLRVFKEAHRFNLKVYKLTKIFPNDEKYRLIDQICRSASSVPANIVEGNARQSKKEFIQFLFQAKGSLSETQYHLMLAKDLGIIEIKIFDELVSESDEIGKMISGLISYLKKSTI